MINEAQMMHGKDWQGQNPTGWLMSEKLRGCRAEWDGSSLWSKGGNEISAPQWFTAGLPPGIRLAGEIYAGRCKIETSARLAVQFGRFERGTHRFMVFDSPTAPGSIQDRLSYAAARLASATHAAVVTLNRCTGPDHLADAMREILGTGGEGLMLHHPTAGWHAGRSNDLLKVKKL